MWRILLLSTEDYYKPPGSAVTELLATVTTDLRHILKGVQSGNQE